MARPSTFKYDETVRITIPTEGFNGGQSVAYQQAAKDRKCSEPMREKLGEEGYAVYANLRDSSYDGVLIIDWTGSILDANTRACEFFRCEPDEICSLDIFELLYGFDALMLDRVRRNMKSGGRFVLIEAYCCRRDGTIFPAEIATTTMELGGDETAAFFVRDITRRREDENALKTAQERLLQAEQLEAAGRTAGLIAHDFNNLLTPLLCLPDLIKQQLPSDSEAVKDLDMIASTAQRLADINQQLLMLSSRGHAEHRPLDLNAIIKSLIELVRRNAEDQVELKLDLSDELFIVLGAEEQLLRVVQNLYHNAVEAMDGKGRLTIKTENVYCESTVGPDRLPKAGEYVKMTISDTGHGIPEDVKRRIYEPFFSTRQNGAKRRGTGLGMSVVFGVLKDHGGYIDLDSEIGRGTVFSVYLPADRALTKLDEQQKSLESVQDIVLIVDDDRLQIDVLTKILEGLGYSVLSASTGEDAVRLVKKLASSGKPPNICVLDIVLGTGMDGAETFQRLREINPGQKAIFISGSERQARVKYAQSLGGGAFLPKPISSEQLGAAIKEELRRPVKAPAKK